MLQGKHGCPDRIVATLDDEVLEEVISSRLEQLRREASGGGSAVYTYDPQKGCPVFSPHSSSVYAPILLLAFTLPVICVSFTSKKP
jgi:hypothetical protein